jgi:hypothetical protein
MNNSQHIRHVGINPDLQRALLLSRSDRRLRVVIVLLFALTTFLIRPQSGQATMSEDHIRAAVIFHIISLTQGLTPPEAMGEQEPTTNPPPSLHLVVLGEDPGGLAAIIADKARTLITANGSMLRVSSLTDHDDPRRFADTLKDCRILYLTKDGMQYLPQIQKKLPSHPILTIGENEVFCQNNGGMICLAIQSQKLVIQINRKLATDAGFHFGAELLRHAVLVDK